jgi:hypothetical protein
MKRFWIVSVAVCSFMLLTLGCASTTLRVYNFPSVGGTEVTIVNSTPMEMEVWVDDQPSTMLFPWGRSTVHVHRTYFNHGMYGEFITSVRVKIGERVVTLSRKFHFSNQHVRKEMWNITERDVMQEYRMMERY